MKGLPKKKKSDYVLSGVYITLAVLILLTVSIGPLTYMNLISLFIVVLVIDVLVWGINHWCDSELKKNKIFKGKD